MGRGSGHPRLFQPQCPVAPAYAIIERLEIAGVMGYHENRSESPPNPPSVMASNEFNTCSHNWEKHQDVDDNIGPSAGNSIFYCRECHTSITLTEKCNLDQVLFTRNSLKIQERSLCVASAALIVSVLVTVLNVLINLSV